MAGGFLFGPQTLMGLFAMELAPPHLAAFAGSVVSVCSQVGPTAVRLLCGSGHRGKARVGGKGPARHGTDATF